MPTPVLTWASITGIDAASCPGPATLLQSSCDHGGSRASNSAAQVQATAQQAFLHTFGARAEVSPLARARARIPQAPLQSEAQLLIATMPGACSARITARSRPTLVPARICSAAAAAASSPRSSRRRPRATATRAAMKLYYFDSPARAELTRLTVRSGPAPQSAAMACCTPRARPVDESSARRLAVVLYVTKIASGLPTGLLDAWEERGEKRPPGEGQLRGPTSALSGQLRRARRARRQCA